MPLPRVAVVSGIHGDEIEGLFVCHELARWLEANPKALKGRVELYPAANPLGLMTMSRAVPVFDTDLNRNFPGHAAGLLPQRMADTIMNHCKDSSLVIDVHASNIFLRELPQVRINEDFVDTLVPLAMDMNLDVIWVHSAITVLEATLSHSLNYWGTPCLVVELGVGMRIHAGIHRTGCHGNFARVAAVGRDRRRRCAASGVLRTSRWWRMIATCIISTPKPSGLFIPAISTLNGVKKRSSVWENRFRVPRKSFVDGGFSRRRMIFIYAAGASDCL